jgi:hypothetical protein
VTLFFSQCSGRLAAGIHENGRENRDNGNEEEGKEEKETLSSEKPNSKAKGDATASPKFLRGPFQPFRSHEGHEQKA